MCVTRKIFAQLAANLFVLLDYPKVFSFLLVLFAFFCILAFFSLACYFLQLKIYVMLHIRLCGRMSDKKKFTRSMSRNKSTFLGLIVEARINKYLTYLKYLHIFLLINNSWVLVSLNHYALFHLKDNFLFHQFFLI